jgi:hypothetical protein
MFFQVAAADNSDTITTAMTIQYGGNVGIGNTSPIEKLDVTKNGNQADVNWGSIMIRNTANYAVGNDASIGFALNNSANSNCDPRASIGCKVESSYGGAIVFNTRQDAGTYAERMRLTSTGNLNIGPATGVGGGPGTSRLNVTGAASVGENTNGTCVMDAFNSYAYYGCNGSTYAIWIGPSGLVYNYSNSTTFNTTSDIRVKENVVTIPNALDKITALNPVTFDYKQDFADHRSWNDTQKNDNIGFIAQEFETVFPKYVHTVEEVINGETVEDFKTIDTGLLVPYLVKAIQELTARVQELENK